MKKSCLLLFMIIVCCVCNAQIINTVIGNGVSGNSGDGGSAATAEIFPVDIAIDKVGNVYIATTSSIREVSASGIITTIAGGGLAGESGDGGPASAALIDYPQSIALDTNGDIYFSEIMNNRIRKIYFDGGIRMINTIAGNGTAFYSGDGGPASAAMIINPTGIACDKLGNCYFGDGNSRIRKISSDGIITTIVGNGNNGYSGDNGPATDAMINQAQGIAVDHIGNIFFADYANNVVRKVNSSGTITTIAGNGHYGYSGDGGPATAAELHAPVKILIDNAGDILFTEYYNDVIRKISSSFGNISTLAGDGIQGFMGDGGPATAARFFDPDGIALDSCDNLWVCDLDNNRVRKITFSYCDFLGVSTTVLPNDLIVYPNPTNDLLQIDNIPALTKYNLYNIIGSILRQGVLKEGNNSMSLNALPTGMYLLELIDDKGNKTVKKIIKE